MASFKYVGDPNDKFSGPDTINQYGYTFRKGETVEIKEPEDDKDAVVPSKERLEYDRIVAKLKGHSHFLDESDKEKAKAVDEKQKALEKAEEDKAKAAEVQKKADEKEAKELEEREKAAEKERANRSVVVENAPRPPGTVTREPVQDAFQGRTVEQRTQAEDHTKAGKTKG